MTKLYLVRHGETIFNIQERIQGQSDSPLTELGVRQAEAIARRLASIRFSTIYSSDSGRAMQTAKIVARSHGLPITSTPLLREAKFGLVQGMTRTEIEEQFPPEEHEWRRDRSLRPPGAETHAQVVARCREFLTALNPPLSGGTSEIAVICHGGSLRGLIIAALDLPVEMYRKMHFSNASLSVIEIGETASLRLLNDTCHLLELNERAEDSELGK